ncbi:glycerate kinase type-2 family protein [Haloferax marisrubri]|uniref:Glycerate kinase n=1 Tax=Haloferax marisrubri TaxID=1544719 RepID=A0A2P4NQV0_9EURY|nr:DUF4147 domain-containing protein [Haloferax marisrubri]POG55500.1 glycerate kinase [Haloferax marisrubri]
MFANRAALAATSEHKLVLDCLEAGIRAAHPQSVIERTVSVVDNTLHVGEHDYDLDDYDRLLVLGGGNAAAHVAAALETCLSDRIDDGLVVTDDLVSLSRVSCVEGSHPIPDASAVSGTAELLELASDATTDDLVLSIVTGGGSALLPAPAGTLTLSDVQAVTETLLRAGATIGEINTVRKHLSAIKGGRLAVAASPADVIGLVFSDVVGNDLGAVASGPVSPDPTTYDDAQAVFDRYNIEPPEPVVRHLKDGCQGEHPETPTEDHPAFAGVDVHVLADNGTALESAAEVAHEHGYEPMILSSHVRGEASEIAKVHVGLAEEALAAKRPVEPPAVVLSGGEATVTVSGDGHGGPNQEFALSAALELDAAGVVVGAVDTDGIDGNTDAAGALVDAELLDDQESAQAGLAQNDVYPHLDATGALLRSGPTGTNVNDLRVMVITST